VCKINKYHDAIELNLIEWVNINTENKYKWMNRMHGQHSFQKMFPFDKVLWWLSFVLKVVDKQRPLLLEIWKHQLLCTNSYWCIHCLVYVCIIGVIWCFFLGFMLFDVLVDIFLK
jgi:hypothetical protein